MQSTKQTQNCYTEIVYNAVIYFFSVILLKKIHNSLNVGKSFIFKLLQKSSTNEFFAGIINKTIPAFYSLGWLRSFSKFNLNFLTLQNVQYFYFSFDNHFIHRHHCILFIDEWSLTNNEHLSVLLLKTHCVNHVRDSKQSHSAQSYSQSKESLVHWSTF